MEPDDDLAFALSLADDADTIAMARFRAADLHVETKPDLTPVSEADRLVESTLRGRIAQERPGEAVLGEEEGGEDTSGWILDPIDGTRNYTRGIPDLGDADRLRASASRVVSAPALGRRWWAERGEGAFADGEPIHVSAIARLEDATLLYALDAASARARVRRVARPRLRRLLGAHARRRGRSATRPSTRPASQIWDCGAGRRSSSRRRGGRSDDSGLVERPCSTVSELRADSAAS